MTAVMMTHPKPGEFYWIKLMGEWQVCEAYAQQGEILFLMCGVGGNCLSMKDAEDIIHVVRPDDKEE